MARRSPAPTAVALVLGCGEAGSAVACALHTSGYSVVLVDGPDPAWHRRGRTFTNAWYVGNAHLDGEDACFCASVKSIPSILARRMIAATTWSWGGVAAAQSPAVIVDARGRRDRRVTRLVGSGAFSIGIGAGFVAGDDVDVVLALPGDSSPAPGPGVFAGRDDGFATCESPADPCVVRAARAGRFFTDRRIADVVRAGEIVGGLGHDAVRAPCSGVLLGLAARGARIEDGDPLVEVDPAGIAHRCHGVSEWARAIGSKVLRAVGAGGGEARTHTLSALPGRTAAVIA